MKKATCDICGKEMSAYGLAGHKRFKHGINTKPHDQVSLEEIVSLRDSMKTKDAEFVTLHDEIAALNDRNKYLESNEYLKTYFLKLTEEGYDQLGRHLFPDRATVEDSTLSPKSDISEVALAKMKDSTQGGATAARGAHNAEVASSTLALATTASVVAPVSDNKPVEEPSIVFHEVKDARWTWYPALGYSIKN